MTLIEGLKKIITGKNKPIDIWHYFVGNYRYKLYYTNGFSLGKPKLMREHIFEQIRYRIKVMNRECYNAGQCIKCGCETTQLQMANKRCDGICYPTMMNKEDWERFKINGNYKEVDGRWMRIITLSMDKTETKKDVFYKETNTGYEPIQ